MAIEAENLAASINGILAEYKDVTNDAIEKAARTVSKEAKRRVQDAAKAKFNGSGEYAKGWSVKIEAKDVSTRATVYNRKEYHLTHLLEYGHAKVNGGRVEGRPHIEPAERWAIGAFEEAIKEAIR